MCWEGANLVARCRLSSGKRIDREPESEGESRTSLTNVYSSFDINATTAQDVRYQGIGKASIAFNAVLAGKGSK